MKNNIRISFTPIELNSLKTILLKWENQLNEDGPIIWDKEYKAMNRIRKKITKEQEKRN